jgi:hypothetical protein
MGFGIPKAIKEVEARPLRIGLEGRNPSRQQPLPLELVDPPFPNFETLGDLSDRPLILIVDFHHPFPQIHGIGFHFENLSHSVYVHNTLICSSLDKSRG